MKTVFKFVDNLKVNDFSVLLWFGLGTFIHKSFVLTRQENYYKLETKHVQDNS